MVTRSGGWSSIGAAVTATTHSNLMSARHLLPRPRTRPLRASSSNVRAVAERVDIAVQAPHQSCPLRFPKRRTPSRSECRR
jgi:hypothetical protein